MSFMLKCPLQESISLWEAKKWIRGITKGDSALFIYKINVTVTITKQSCIMLLLLFFAE